MKFTKIAAIGLLSLGLGCGAAKKAGDNAMDKVADESQKQATEQTEKMEEAAGEEAKRAALETAASGAHRSDQNKARNQHRNPVDTLLFFGVEPDDTVVEIWPGGGWYTEVLAPYLAAEGQLIAASYAPKEDPEHYRSKTYNKFKNRLESEPVFKSVSLGMLEPGQKVDIGEPKSADFVLTFRNIHSFVRADVADTMFAEANKILKDGGILGVVQHRAKEGVTDIKKSADTGYVPESYVLQLAEAHGFELVEKSDINANPKDTTEWPEGVWTLPPSLRLGDTDKDKYMSIGESDRMTMKFKKVKEAGEMEPGEPEPDTTPDPEKVTE